MTAEIIIAILTIAGIPSLVTAFVFNRIMKRMDTEKQARDDNMCMLIELSIASMELSEATAISYKNNLCNGEITAALDKAKKIKASYTEFMTRQCVKSI